MDLKELLEQQKQIEAQIQQAIIEEKKNLKVRFDSLVADSGFARSEVLEILGLKETGKKSAPTKSSKSLDLPKGTLLSNGTDVWEVGSRGKKPAWVAEALANNTYKSLVQK